MPRTKKFNEQEVLTKAMELFWEKGFHATSMQDLVLRLGINRASLYDTFGGKEELFNRAFAEYRSTAGDWLHGVFAAEDSVKNGFHSLFLKAIDEAVNDPCRKGCFVVNTTTELVPGDPAIQETLLTHKTAIERLFEGYVQQGINSGEIAPDKDAKAIGVMLFTLYNGLRVVSKVDTDRAKLEQIATTALTVLD